MLVYQRVILVDINLVGGAITCFNHLEKYEFVNGKDWEGSSHILWKIQAMFQTTNQWLILVDINDMVYIIPWLRLISGLVFRWFDDGTTILGNFLPLRLGVWSAKMAIWCDLTMSIWIFQLFKAIKQRDSMKTMVLPCLSPFSTKFMKIIYKHLLQT